MHPKLFDVFGQTIYSYGFMLMIGFILALYIAGRRAKSVGIKPDFITDLAIWAIISGILGARLAYILECEYSGSSKIFKDGWKIFNIFDGNMSWLGALIGIGVGAALVLAYRVFSSGSFRFRRENGSLKPGAIVITVLIVAVSVVGMSRAWKLHFTEVEATNEAGVTSLKPLHDSPQYNLSYLAVRSGGLTFYGGMIPTAIIIFLISWRRKYSVWKVADVAAPSLMLGLAFGRIGCFLNGCCWGGVAKDGFWSSFAVRFPKDSEVFHSQIRKLPIGSDFSLPVIPTQIISSLAVFGIFLLLSWYFWKKHRNGEVFVLMCGTYALFRFLIEFIRGDNARPGIGLTFSQWISIGMVAAALLTFLLLRFGKRGKPAQASSETEPGE